MPMNKRPQNVEQINAFLNNNNEENTITDEENTLYDKTTKVKNTTVSNSDQQDQPKRNLTWLWILLLSILLVVGGYYVLNQNKDESPITPDVTQSDTEVVHRYRKAAEQGDADAQYNLGFCYYNGNGVTQSYTEAVKWYKKAAKQGLEVSKQSLDRLGIDY